MNNKTIIETEYKVGDLVIIKDERKDTSEERKEGYNFSTWRYDNHMKRNILVSGKLGQVKKGSVYCNSLHRGDEGRIINILSDSESDNGNTYVVGFETKDVNYYNKDKYKNRTTYSTTRTNYNDGKEYDVEYIYLNGCLLNETNFYKKDSVEDYSNQIGEVKNLIEDVETTIRNSKLELMELKMKEKGIVLKIEEVL